MPLLGGLFSRKNKSSRPPKNDDHATSSIHSTADLDSTLSSPTGSSYITPDRSIPSYPNASNLLHPNSARETLSHDDHAPRMSSTPTPSSGGHRLRLFGRKKSNMGTQEMSAASAPDVSSKAYTTPTRPSTQSRSTTSETDPADLRRLRPPPSRSAIFAAYGDPNSALSTRSLPNENFNGSDTSLSTPSPPAPGHKRPSLFAWTKSSSSAVSSSPTISPPNESMRLNESMDSPLSQENSFNLKSFRHIRPPSPPPTNGSNVSLSLNTPIPRPRGASINSDASQRISVAAFREAQARRSLAGSPSPSFRDTSPAPGVPSPRAMTPDGSHHPRPARSIPSMPQQRRRSSMAIASTTESDDDSSDVDSEIEVMPSPLDNRKRSGKAKARSEMGHGESSFKRSVPPMPTRSPRSHSGHTFVPAPRPVTQYNLQEEEKKPEVPPRSQSSLGVYGGVRPRASLSASALSPSAAAKRASTLAASNADTAKPSPSDGRISSGHSQTASPITRTPPQQQPLQTPPPPASRPFKGKASSHIGHNTSMNSQADSDSDSEDNAPLATLVGPRRPGSAMSSYSNLHSRSVGNVATRSSKPLIDINELTGPKRQPTTPAEEDPAAFTAGPTLLARGRQPSYSPSPSFTPKPLVESPTSLSPPSPWREEQEPLTRKEPPVKFVSPPGSPAKEMKQFIGDISTDNESKPFPTPIRRETNQERKRDLFADRLSRVVKQSLTSPPTSAPTTPAAPPAPVPAQLASPAPSPSPAPAPAPSPTPASLPAPRLTSIPRDLSPRPGELSDSSRTRSSTERPRVVLPRGPPPPMQLTENDSPPDEGLAQLLGSAGIRFISRSGETPDESTESESEESDEEDKTDQGRIAPIPIKQRSPPPAFSVTSRPPIPRQLQGSASMAEPTQKKISSSHTTPSPASRPRSSTLITSSSSTSFMTPKPTTMSSYTASTSSPTHVSSKSLTHVTQVNGNTSILTKTERTTSTRGAAPQVRQRSTTMITGVPLSSQMPRTFPGPDKPFAARRNSPASSTGDSSSGRAPFTPRDGSEIGAQDEQVKEKERKQDEWSGGASGLGLGGTRRGGHVKRRSVSFEEDLEDLKPPSRSHIREGSTRTSSDGGHSRSSQHSRSSHEEEDRVEVRRRERRRSEAKAAIELGNVINGPGPVVDDDDDDMPINQAMNMNPRMSTINPMMAMGNPMGMPMGFGGSPMSSPPGWGGNMGAMGQSMLSPAQFMVPPPADPNFLAAHQQAMMIAKQAYQMAVAQQAMAAAADEWERGSAYGGGGSVYGGSSAQSMMGSPYGMMGMLPQGGGWSGAASVYGGSGGSGGGGQMYSSSRSDYGGGGGGGRSSGANWSSSRSTYGESFGPSSDPYARKAGQSSRSQMKNGQPRDSGYFPPVPPLPALQDQRGRSSPDQRGSGPRSRTTSQPASPPRGLAMPKKAPPPSSWKASGV